MKVDGDIPVAKMLEQREPMDFVYTMRWMAFKKNKNICCNVDGTSEWFRARVILLMDKQCKDIFELYEFDELDNLGMCFIGMLSDSFRAWPWYKRLWHRITE